MEHPISQRIKILIDRESNGKVVDFASKLEGIPYQVISRLFKPDARSGKYPTPSTDLILEIINKFTFVSIPWFITGVGEMLKSQENIYNLENNISIMQERNSYDNSDIYWKGRYDELREQFEKLQKELEELKYK